jgi:hypothetical protein
MSRNGGLRVTRLEFSSVAQEALIAMAIVLSKR